MMDVNTIWPFHLTRGHSKDPRQGACLMDAISWFEYGMLNDHPPCVSPILVILGQVANDWSDDGQRQTLKRLIPKLVGTALDQRADHLRADYVRFSWHHFVGRFQSQMKPISHLLSPFEENPEPEIAPLSTAYNVAKAAIVLMKQHKYFCLYDPDYKIDCSYILANSWDPNASVVMKTVQLGDEVLRLIFDMLEVCCAIGSREPEWDFSQRQEAVEAFQRAREPV
jgi:hypothetical protein